MLDFVLGILLLASVIGVALWAGRTRPTGDGGSNVDAARRYGPGIGG